MNRLACVFRLCAKAIEDAGGCLDNIIRTHIMLTDISTWREAAQAHGELLLKHQTGLHLC